MNRFEGKAAIVTGGARGIGEAIVNRLLSEKAASVAIFDLNENLAKETAARLDPAGKRTMVLGVNVGIGEQVADAVKSVVEAFGKIDVLINNSGITCDKMFHKMQNDEWDRVINVNLNGVYYVCREVFPVMREAGGGRIVNIASISAFGNVGQSNYAASKAGVIGLTRTLALEGGRKNITANCIAPGYIFTDMLKSIPQKALDEYVREIPLGRFGQPEEIASTAAFLASDDAAYISGQTIIVSGASRIV